MSRVRVAVVMGGPSAEREVSLVSGKAVIEGLKSMGHDVFASDVSPADLSGLDRPADVIFPVLHGQFGESGELQEILEARNLPFVGSGSKASRLGPSLCVGRRIACHAAEASHIEPHARRQPCDACTSLRRC